MPRNTVGLVWIFGLLLTAALYAIGPDRFIAVAMDGLNALINGLGDAITALISQAFELIRALAIGLFVVFWVLGVMAARRGQRAKGALFFITLLYVAFLYPAAGGGYVSGNNWFCAFVLAAIGAAIMTRRVSSPPPLPPAPWPSARAP